MKSLQALHRGASARLLLARRGTVENGREEQPSDTAIDMDQSPLDATLSRIGFGLYQKKLLILCGFGWLADNMWLQCVAVIIPRVQAEFGISDQWIGTLSSSIFLGMMIGAWSWGSYSDSFGRITPFNGTLLLTSIFGIAACFVPSFFWLCACFFGLGLGVGGSMPTDGTIFLENLPKEHHYLLTALSVFFSMGAMVTSTLALLIIPKYACQSESTRAMQVCDVSKEAGGWRVLLGFLAGVTLFFFVCRLALFRLHESPKFLVNTGREEQAATVLKRIAAHNGTDMHIELSDVADFTSKPHQPISHAQYEGLPDSEVDAETVKPRPVDRRPSYRSLSLPETIEAYLERMAVLLQPDMKLTTLLVWGLWFSVSAAYTMFNVFLPKFLEEKLGTHVETGGLVETLQEYCIYTFAGFPGSLVGAYLETTVGQRESMALSTIATSIGIFGFVFVRSKPGVVFTSAAISFSATFMYAVIYGYTPRLFPVAHRGSATGIASALSRLAGITCPVITGTLLHISTALPLFLASALFLLSAVLMALLPR